MRKPASAVLLSLMVGAFVAIAGCSSNSPDDHTDGGGGDGGTLTPSCDTPMPPAATQHSLVIASPSDPDPTANPAATTEIFYTVMTPARCAGDAFPVVLQSHGYGGARETTLAADGTLHPESPHFPSMDQLTQALPYHGYVVISFDERGHGESTNANARIIDPAAETQDARALLDWAYDHADEFGILRQSGTGIERDIKVGTLGYSYGGGFQMPLAAIDPRIDAIVPQGTWHGLLYSLMPGDSLKLGFGGLLCVLAITGGVANTPIVATLCNTIGPVGLGAYNVRSRADLVAAVSRPTSRPRAVTEAEMIPFFDTHGMSYFRRQQKAGNSWGFGEREARLRKVPACGRESLASARGERGFCFSASSEKAEAPLPVLTDHPLPHAGEGTARSKKAHRIAVDSMGFWLQAKVYGASRYRISRFTSQPITTTTTARQVSL